MDRKYIRNRAEETMATYISLKGASEYFKRTENIAGVKVGLVRLASLQCGAYIFRTCGFKH